MDTKKAFSLIALILFPVTVISIYFETVAAIWRDYDVNLRVVRLLNIENTKANEDEKKILLWTSFFKDDWFFLGKSGHFVNCPEYNNCLMTRSRRLVDITQFDAIVFHGNEINHGDMPTSRDPRQQYVFVNLESPKNRPLLDSSFDNFFNLTMTYRLDSDILWPYYVLRNMSTNEMVAPLPGVDWPDPSYDPMRFMLDGQFEKKKKTAAWLVSNCETYGRRELYVDELMKYVKVDRFGKCGDRERCKSSSGNCFKEVIEPEYFFYLSFENTLCQDYVTEKFSNPLRHNIIPVVYGGANYSLYAPPHSYIDALDFDSPKALANYLIELSQNKEEYLKYFWWKRFYTVDSARNWTLCNICKLLHVEKPRQTYSDLRNWFEKDKCPIQNHLKGDEYATQELRSRITGNTQSRRVN